MVHYLVEMKRTNMSRILTIIKSVPAARLQVLKEELFDKLGLTPSLTNKYLQELEELGKIKIDWINNTAVAVRSEEEEINKILS